jgi:lipopolysaccharide assembly protein A
MTEAPAPPGLTSTVPPPSANGSTPSAQPPPAPQPPPAQPPPPRRRSAHTRISGLRTGLIAGVLVLIVVLIFIIQNTHVVNISFLGAHLRLSLAVALLLAAIAGALVMAVAGTARITQLRQHMRRDRHNSQVS